MAEGAPLHPFKPPLLWDVDTCLWDFVVEQGLSGREPHQEIVALKEEIFTKISTDVRVLGSLILRFDCLLTPRWHTSWMAKRLGFDRWRIFMDCEAGEESRSPALVIQHLLKRTPGE